MILYWAYSQYKIAENIFFFAFSGFRVSWLTFRIFHTYIFHPVVLHCYVNPSVDNNFAPPEIRQAGIVDKVSHFNTMLHLFLQVSVIWDYRQAFVNSKMHPLSLLLLLSP
jgi:hypothetical protein